MKDSDGRFLGACRREEVDRTPVWFMRQAGRYMAEYRALRQKYSLLELCRNPELAAEVTLQPIRRFDLDAAIIFADILLPLQGMGVDFDFARGEGPVIHEPVRTADVIRKLRIGEPEEDLSFVLEAIRLVRRTLDPGIALIGFAGAPFTVASYMIEGGHSRQFRETKTLMYRSPALWKQLMEKLSAVLTRYLAAQIESGAQAIQMFDSWVGCLSADDYRHYILPYTKRIFDGLGKFSVPMIHFGTGTAMLLELMKEAGGTVIGLDWRVSLQQAWLRLGEETVLQGNLDPLALLAPPELLKQKVDRVLADADGRLGHIFNLGHGILPQTSPEAIEAVIERVHSQTKRAVGERQC